MEVAYKIKLGRRVEAKLCCVGKFDGVHPALACATGSTGQVIVFDPHEVRDASSSEPPLRVFNFNKNLTALACGPLKPTLRLIKPPGSRAELLPGLSSVGDRDNGPVRDVLLVGLASTVLAYDVEMNSDIFFKEVQDGANTLTFSLLAVGNGELAPVVLVGGNCSVVGLDMLGAEAFWTVAGDNVTAVATNPVRGGAPQVVVGSDDYEIKVYEGEDVVAEVTEADRVQALVGLGDGRFAYGLANGTVGVYDGPRRAWRVKSKQSLVSLAACDFFTTTNTTTTTTTAKKKGAAFVVAAWSNGAVTVRAEADGSFIFRDVLEAGFARVLCADLRNDPTRPSDVQCVAVTLDGEIRGLVPAVAAAAAATASGTTKTRASNEAALRRGEAACAELQAAKRALLMELRHLEDSVRQLRDDAPSSSAFGVGGTNKTASTDRTNSEMSLDAIPSDTEVTVDLSANEDTGGYDLVFAVANHHHHHHHPHSEAAVGAHQGGGALIVSVVVTDSDGGLFPENAESICAMPAAPQPTCRVALNPRKNVAAHLRVQVHVAARASSTVLHVFELGHTLPKFCTFLRVVEPRDRPSGYVQFQVPARLDAVVAWAAKSFVNMGPVHVSAREATLQLHYVAVPVVPSAAASPNAVDPPSEGGLLLPLAVECDAARRRREGTTVQQQQQHHHQQHQYQQEPLWVEARQTSPDVVAVKISAGSMSTAAELVQDLAAHLAVHELDSSADFPREMDQLRAILDRVSKANAIRMRLTADMADGSHRVKALVVKAEDARLMSDMPLMRRHYAELFGLNAQLIAEYTKRATNHNALLGALKEVNQTIQRASNLRVGAPKTRVVADARQAIKANNVAALYAIMCDGKNTTTTNDPSLAQ